MRHQSTLPRPSVPRIHVPGLNKRESGRTEHRISLPTLAIQGFGRKEALRQGINSVDNTNSIIILPEYLLPPTDRTTQSDVEDTTINELNDHNDNAGENENNNTLGRLSNTRDHVGCELNTDSHTVSTVQQTQIRRPIKQTMQAWMAAKII
jgi:hypothetical protein